MTIIIPIKSNGEKIGVLVFKESYFESGNSLNCMFLKLTLVYFN